MTEQKDKELQLLYAKCNAWYWLSVLFALGTLLIVGSFIVYGTKFFQFISLFPAVLSVCSWYMWNNTREEISKLLKQVGKDS